VVIGAARVTLTGVDTGARVSTESNETGVYRFDAVDLGVYDLTVTSRPESRDPTERQLCPS
jgi:hypothetical protein